MYTGILPKDFLKKISLATESEQPIARLIKIFTEEYNDTQQDYEKRNEKLMITIQEIIYTLLITEKYIENENGKLVKNQILP